MARKVYFVSGSSVSVNKTKIAQKIDIIHNYKAQICLCVYLTLCDTAGRTNIKLGTINHFLGMSVISVCDVMMMSQSKLILKNYLKL